VQKERTNAFVKGSTICVTGDYLLCMLKSFERYPLTGECPLERDNGSDVYPFASNICTSEKCKVLLTSARLRDNKKAMTR